MNILNEEKPIPPFQSVHVAFGKITIVKVCGPLKGSTSSTNPCPRLLGENAEAEDKIRPILTQRPP